MARPLRLEYPGAVHHVTARGNARGDIFADDVDRRIFLRLLGEVVENLKWRVYAYCLMGNHYHLLIETPEANLSRGMRQLNGIYTQRFNRRHERVGHILQGRFKAILVDRESYLLELARYIALNPVRAGLVQGPEAWRWSSYRATAGIDNAPAWLAARPVLESFSPVVGEAQRRYGDFVAAGQGLPSPWARLQGQIFLGSEAFVRNLAPKLDPMKCATETPRAQRLAGRPSLEGLLPERRAADVARRNRAIADAHYLHGYTLSEIARHLGMHYSTVSRIARRPMREGKT